MPGEGVDGLEGPAEAAFKISGSGPCAEATCRGARNEKNKAVIKSPPTAMLLTMAKIRVCFQE